MPRAPRSIRSRNQPSSEDTCWLPDISRCSPDSTTSNIRSNFNNLYQTGGVKETVSLDHIKRHYYGSHKTINPTGIVPKGPALDYDAPHDRDRFTSQDRKR